MREGKIITIVGLIWSIVLLGMIFFTIFFIWTNYLEPRFQDVTQKLNQQNSSQQNLADQITALTQSINSNEKKYLLDQVGFIMQLANLQIIVNQNPQKAQELLQQIYTNPKISADPAFASFKNALAQDIESLKSAHTVNVPAIIEKLDNLNTQIQNLPLRNRSFPPTNNTAANQKTLGSADSWYTKYFGFLSSLKDLIIIRRLDQPVSLLLTAEQELYLKENIQTKIFQAEWAVLHQQPDLYQASLNQVKKWLESYFSTAPNLKSIINNITVLQSINLKSESSTIANSLQAFDKINDTKINDTKKPTKLSSSSPETLI